MKSPKDVLALGRVIVRELELAARGTVLQRWMAHHLAEVLAEADTTEAGPKADAEARAVELVLELWRNRRWLPGTVDPLAGVRETIDMLSFLESNPWRSASDGKHNAILRETFDVLAKVVVLGALLPGHHRRQASPEEIQALSPDEGHLSALLERWVPYAREARKSRSRWEYILAGTTGTDDSREREVERADLAAQVTEERDDHEAAIRDEIVRELRAARAALKKLVKHWRSPIDSQLAVTDQPDLA